MFNRRAFDPSRIVNSGELNLTWIAKRVQGVIVAEL